MTRCVAAGANSRKQVPAQASTDGLLHRPQALAGSALPKDLGSCVLSALLKMTMHQNVTEQRQTTNGNKIAARALKAPDNAGGYQAKVMAKNVLIR